MTAPHVRMKADLFKAMGNPVRIRVLELLSDREWSVGEMIGELGTGASGLSQHLSVLRAVGLVQARREASTVYYALTTPLVADLLAVARKLRSHVLELQMEVLSDLRDDDEQNAAGRQAPAPDTSGAPATLEQRTG
jgi:DNA-binding transcriptional ArsR family regulator